MNPRIFDFNAYILPEIVYMDTSYIRELYGQMWKATSWKGKSVLSLSQLRRQEGKRARRQEG